MTSLPPKIILASTSPRRRELLGLLGAPFEVIGSDFDEDSLEHLKAKTEDWVMNLAVGKAMVVAQQTEGDALVIGADTTVTLNNKYYNKPTGPEDACRMLRELSGQTHQVHTGICIIPVTNSIPGTPITNFAVTDVTFDIIPEHVIQAYAETGEPLDKAGAYGIQGKALS